MTGRRARHAPKGHPQRARRKPARTPSLIAIMACCPAATGLASAAAGQLGGPALDSAIRYLRHDNGKVDDYA